MLSFRKEFKILVIAGLLITGLTAQGFAAPSMVPALNSAWASVQAANLDAELFRFDATKISEIRAAMDSVRMDIVKLESVAPGGTRDQVFEALNLLKPSLKKAFLMFGKYQP